MIVGARFITIGCLTLLVACGGVDRRTGKSGDLWWADKHDDSPTTSPPPTPDRKIPVLSRAKARLELRAELARAKPRELYVLVYANRLLKAGGAVSAAHRNHIRGLVDRLDETTLAETWKELDRPYAPSRAVALRLALVAHHLGDATEALRLLTIIASWRTRGDASIETIAAKLKQRIARTQKANPRVIAVLLPLTGHYRKLGREMRLAIVVAAALSPGTRLVFIDTKGVPKRAMSAVDEAVFVHKATAILGPVGQRESVAAARRAVALNIPIALLAPATNGASARDGVFRLWSSPEWEARQTARLAISLGYTRLAILAPRDEVGKAQATAFRLAAAAVRARVVRVGFYDPARTAVEKDIKAFLKLDPKNNRRLRRHLARRGWKRGWKSFSPRVPFDLLYIPDNYKRASLIASYMPYFNVEVRTSDTMNIYHLRRKHGGRYPRVVQLFGSSGWHHPGLITRGGKAVQGALVVDLYSGSDTEEYAYEAGVAFARAFKRKVGRVPGAVAAQTFDAAVLLFNARARAARIAGGGYPRAHTNVKTVRTELRRQLRGSRVNGACGPAIVDRNGEIRRSAIMLRVDGGDFVPHAH